MNTTGQRFRLGEVVSYRGTHQDCRGIPFRVVAVLAVGDSPARYDLTYEFGLPSEVVLKGVRGKSLFSNCT